jgi:hypothetical protein
MSDIFSTKFSACGRHRLRLHKRLKEAEEKYVLVGVGCNPSKAGQPKPDGSEKTDNTFIKFEKRGLNMGATDLILINLNPYVATEVEWVNFFLENAGAKDVADMYHANREAIKEVMESWVKKTVICMWGKEDKFFNMDKRAKEFTEQYHKSHQLTCIAFNKDGSPKHPLLHSTASPLEIYA